MPIGIRRGHTRVCSGSSPPTRSREEIPRKLGRDETMKAALRPHLGVVALLALSTALSAAPAAAAPLGLAVGDTISSIEWDALTSTPGQGGAYSDATNLF